jgi:hypothetical protein
MSVGGSSAVSDDGEEGNDVPPDDQLEIGEVGDVGDVGSGGYGSDSIRLSSE